MNKNHEGVKDQETKIIFTGKYLWEASSAFNSNAFPEDCKTLVSEIKYTYQNQHKVLINNKNSIYG